MSFEQYCRQQLDLLQDSKVKDAMIYSFFGSGKRVRPNFLFETLKGYGLDETIGYPCAMAIEMIHTYSLIHDDLPAMDNDSLRRGKPTCHIAFDEATAILAGDGLLTYAFEVISKSDLTAEQKVKCIQILAQCAGSSGMIYGQVLDMQAEQEPFSWEQCVELQIHKTGQLFYAPCAMAAMIAGHEEDLDKLWKFAQNFGLAFQIQDDILDVTKSEQELGKSNSDVRNEKTTSVSLLGLEQAQQECEKCFTTCYEYLDECAMDAHSFKQYLEVCQRRQY